MRYRFRPVVPAHKGIFQASRQRTRTVQCQGNHDIFRLYARISLTWRAFRGFRSENNQSFAHFLSGSVWARHRAEYHPGHARGDEYSLCRQVSDGFRLHLPIPSIPRIPSKSSLMIPSGSKGFVVQLGDGDSLIGLLDR